jgi:hypothetical protein
MSLARFQDAFAQALLAPGAAHGPEIATLAAQPGFAVYRNTVMKACIDALQANYPAVARLVGEEWFRAAAAIHVRQAPPAEPALLRYGAGFAEFLARFGPAAELPYLSGVARLDRFWTEAHAAPSVPALAVLTGNEALHPHPAARWAWFADAPIYTIWARNRSAEPADAELAWRPEGALLTRPGDAVEWRALDAAGCAFLDACAVGGTLAQATQAALQAQGATDLTALFSTLIQAGALARTPEGAQP